MSLRYFHGYLNYGNCDYSSYMIPFTDEKDFVNKVLDVAGDVLDMDRYNSDPLIDYMHSLVDENYFEDMDPDCVHAAGVQAAAYHYDIYTIALDLIFPNEYVEDLLYRIIED